MIIDEPIYGYLVRVFYSNMKLSKTRKDRVITQVSSVRIKFDIFKLYRILGTHLGGLQIYATRKKLMFNDFRHASAVRNIYHRRDLYMMFAPYHLDLSFYLSRFTS